MTVHGPRKPGSTVPGNTPGGIPGEAFGDAATAACSDDVHDMVGAYALGVLDPEEMTVFEEHLADCERCAGQLEELIGMGPLLSALADTTDLPEPGGLPGPGGLADAGGPTGAGGSADRSHGSNGSNGSDGSAGSSAGSDGPEGAAESVPAGVALASPPASSVPGGAARARSRAEDLAARPGPELAERLLVDVAAHRARRRRRTWYAVAAAAVLLVASPLVTLAVRDYTGADKPSAANYSGYQGALQNMAEKVQATDPDTKVSALIGMSQRPWGTDLILELKNVKGPLKCSLIVVGSSGHGEPLASWSVPPMGYGLADSPNKAARSPLYVWSATDLTNSDIDHFEVRTEKGRHLVTVDARTGA